MGLVPSLQAERGPLLASPLAYFFDEETELHQGFMLSGTEGIQAVDGPDTDASKVHLIVDGVALTDTVDHALGYQANVRGGRLDSLQQLAGQRDFGDRRGDLVGLFGKLGTVGDADVGDAVDGG